MTNKLFDSAVVFTDIHFGLKGDSADHNQDCIDFIEWMIAYAKERGIKTAVFTGDYFHNRKHVNVSTLWYGMRGLELLNNNFEKTYFLVGNHDMYHKNRREMNSTSIAGMYPNIVFIDAITTIKDCSFVPFLIDDEHITLPSLTSKYIFGHFELPGYLLNKMVEMPDHGKENEDMFKCEYVISGHFHKRQIKKNKIGTNIIYLGNCFPHNFSDSWDDERGLMILSDATPTFEPWPGAPSYRDVKLSVLQENPALVLKPKVSAKIYIDKELKVEELAELRTKYKEQYQLRDVMFVPQKTSVQDVDETKIVDDTSATLDTIVVSQLRAVETNTLNHDLLVAEYLSLGEIDDKV